MKLVTFLHPIPLNARSNRSKHLSTLYATAKNSAPCDSNTLASFTSSNRKISDEAVRAIRTVYTQQNGAVHRGGCAHDLGRKAAELMTSARKHAAQFVDADLADFNIIFSDSVSAAVNLIAHSAAKTFRKGDSILVSSLASDDIIIPLQIVAKRRKLKLNFVSSNVAEGFDNEFESIASSVSSRTKIVVLQHVSPLFSNVTELEEIIAFLKSFGTMVVVDATHSISLTSVSVTSLQCDFLIVGGEGIGCPSGATFIGAKSSVLNSLPPVAGGENSLQDFNSGSMRTNVLRQSSNWGAVPERFEVGMAPLSTAASIEGALREAGRSDRRVIAERSLHLGQKLFIELSKCPNTIVYGNGAQARAASVCFNVCDMDAEVVAKELAKRGVVIDVGLHGARFAHRELGIEGSLRVVLDGCEDCEEDVVKFVQVLSEITKKV